MTILNDIVLKTDDPTKGMPPHPALEGFPVLCLDEGDQWLFRRSTNALVPKASVVNASDPIVRYVICAVRRAGMYAGAKRTSLPVEKRPIDWVIWQEIEQIQEDGNTAIVTPILCFGPARVANEEYLQASVEAAMTGFRHVYEDPRWISQYESGLSFLVETDNKFIKEV